MLQPTIVGVNDQTMRPLETSACRFGTAVRAPIILDRVMCLCFQRRDTVDEVSAQGEIVAAEFSYSTFVLHSLPDTTRSRSQRKCQGFV